MANWEYRVESVSMADKWSAKKQQQEINDFQANLDSLGSGMGDDLLRERPYVRLVQYEAEGARLNRPGFVGDLVIV